jgi:DNA-binding NarL/FixJ family response regulator
LGTRQRFERAPVKSSSFRLAPDLVAIAESAGVVPLPELEHADTKVLVIAASDAGRTRAATLADVLGPRGVVICGLEGLSRGIDRRSVHVGLVAQDNITAQHEAVRLLKSFPASLPVLVEMDATNAASLVTLMRAGADGIVAPDASRDAVWRSVGAALAGEVVLPRSAVRYLAAELRLAGLRDESSMTALRDLSRREREVVLLLYAGLSTGEVARRLFLSATTVRSHIHAAIRKLGVSSRDDVFRCVDEG